MVEECNVDVLLFPYESIETLSVPHSPSAVTAETAGPRGPFGGGRPAGPLRGAALQLHRLQQDALR